MELDPKAIKFSIAAGLPIRARWMIDGTPLDFEFTAGYLGLHRLPDEVLQDSNPSSSDWLVFGGQSFAEGGGASPSLCVRKRDGSVYGFDREREEPEFLLNSSIDRFVATFWLLNDYLAKNNPLPIDCESRLQAIDPETYQNSDWRLLVERLRGAGPDAAPDS